MRVNLAVLVLLSPLASAWAQTSVTYQLTDLGTLNGTACPAFMDPGIGRSSFARALNERAQVAGASCATNPTSFNTTFHAFRWSAGAMTHLGTLGLGSPDASVAYGINDAGQVVGRGFLHETDAGTPFLWSGGTMSSLAPAVGGEGSANDINNAGQIVGARYAGIGLSYQAYVYDLGGGLTPLPGLGGIRSQAMAINDAGVVAGSASTPGDAAWHAVRWTSGVPLDLGTLGGTHSYGWAVNGAGDVVGQSWITGDDGAHAFLYAGGSMHDLGTLGVAGSVAFGINDSGLVVGWAFTASGGPHAFVHDGAAMHDLNDLIPPGSGWVLTEATAINAQGEIAGTGLLAGERRAFLLTPGQAFFTVPPCRLVDTRNAAGPRGGPALDAGSTRTFPLAGSCEIPSNARAVSVNVAVTGPTAAGHLRAYPGGAPEPVASVVNYSAGQTRANNAVLRLGADGDLTVRCNQAAGSVQVIIDVNGYYLAAPPAGGGPTLRR